MSDIILELDSNNINRLPFALLAPRGGERVRIPNSHLQYREAKLRAFLENNPVLGDMSTDTHFPIPTRSDHNTTVHDGNHTYTMTDTEDDDSQDDVSNDD